MGTVMVKPSTKAIGKFLKRLQSDEVEKKVVDIFQDLVGTDMDFPWNSDGVSNGTLYEFKPKQAHTPAHLAKVLAQLVCYLRRFYKEGTYSGKRYELPLRVAACCATHATVVATKQLESIFHSDQFEWKRAASNPDPAIVLAVMKLGLEPTPIGTPEEVQGFLDALESIGSGDDLRQQVTRENFDSVFLVWRSQLFPGLGVRESARAYMLDLLGGAAPGETGKIIFMGGADDKPIVAHVLPSAYQQFWRTYRRPPTNEELQAITERKDRLIAIQQRRETGEFFTPIDIAKLSHDYLVKVVPDAYENWNWWDPAAGTGNLTLHCPDMHGRLFMSTLGQEDVDLIRESGQNSDATLFQYDFLNGKDEELPLALLSKLKPGSKWVFMLNPPFAAGTDLHGSFSDGTQKAGVSDTAVGDRMEELKLGHACQNMQSQFLWKILELRRRYHLNVAVATYGKAIDWTGSGYKMFRTKWGMDFQFKGGFAFHSQEFHGSKGAWPVTFTIWGSADIDQPGSRPIVLDVVERSGVELEVTGRKAFAPPDRLLNKWVDRPKATEIRPAMKGALTLATSAVRLDRLSDRSIGYLRQTSNDVRDSATGIYFLSGPDSSGNGWSVTPSNFSQSMLVLAARKLVKQTWLNNKDQFSVPNIEHPDYDQFSRDAVVWGLFHNSNQSSAIPDVVYQKKHYTIANEFFWMDRVEFRAIEGLPRFLFNQAQKAPADPFVATWLRGKTFSEDAQLVLTLGKKLVTVAGKPRGNGVDARFFLGERWDAGWYQVRNGLYGDSGTFKRTPEMLETYAAFKTAYAKLTERLRPMIYQLGFLPKEESYTAEPEEAARI